MDYIYSKTVIEKNNLIPRKISKKIINFINFENKSYESQKDTNLSKFITYENLLELRKKFQKYKKNKRFIKPRNYMVYKFIKNLNSKFYCDFDKQKTKPEMPQVDGIRLSLSSILLNNLNLIKNDEIERRLIFFNSFKKVIEECNFKNPNLDEIEKFYLLLTEVKKKRKTLTIVTPCCPDYSKKKIKDKYEFTFKTIENGVGLVAQRLALNIDQIHEFLDNMNIKYRHIITIGDFEAFSKTNQKRLKLNEKEFLKKTNINQEAISKHFIRLKNTITNKSFVDIFGNKTQWKKTKNYILNKITNKDFLCSVLKKNELDEILKARIPLYKRWYGELSKDKYQKILFDQSSEYAAMSSLINKKYKHSLVIGADHFKMSKFYKLGSNIPVFYLKKNYIT